MKRTIQSLVSRIAGLLVAVLASTGFVDSALAIPFTDSNQLNLANRQILSAVSFYHATGGQPNSNVTVTGPIQGATIANFDYSTVTTLNELTLNAPNPTVDRGQTGGSIVGTGPDQPFAVELARSFTFWSGSQLGSLSYAFGSGFANTAVQVQLVGGDTGWDGVMQATANAIIKGTMAGDNNGGTAEILTFNAITNGSGNLVVDLTVTSGNFFGLAGAFVTAEIPPPLVPEPSTFVLLGLGTLAIGSIGRRHRARAA